jgi:hypothetical protein
MVSVNGQRTQDNNYTMDGVDNNMMFMNSPGGSPPMDAIQEFRVATGNSAEYGRSAGANVNVSIKSGSRDLHGARTGLCGTTSSTPMSSSPTGRDGGRFRSGRTSTASRSAGRW